MALLNLFGTLSRVEVPFVKVVIGDYTFGVYTSSDDKARGKLLNSRINRDANGIQYPDYIQSLEVQKVNGTVNHYSLAISYPITPGDDPNFFEKVFSSVSATRKIVFSYGDVSVPASTCKDESALITKVSSSVSVSGTKIDYTVTAISSSCLLSSCLFPFHGGNAKPSDLIKKMLYEGNYGLLDVFPGMANRNLVETKGLIASDDRSVYIEDKPNISVFDFLNYLVGCMRPDSDAEADSVKKGSLYMLTVVDDAGASGSFDGSFGGPYFKVVRSNGAGTPVDTYAIDIGYPSQNIVKDFSVSNNESYALYYSFADGLTDSSYVQHINDLGELEAVYAPLVASGNDRHCMTETERNWWTKMTEYPITASITVAGLLRPAILMSKVKLNVYFYGQKYIYSGVYIVTKQVDTVSSSGYFTRLTLIRVEGDSEPTL